MLLSVKNIEKKFGSKEVLKGIDFEINRGEVVTLLGPSGSGKTTLLRSINCLELPQNGHLHFYDPELTIDFSKRIPQKDILNLRQRTSMVFQHHYLFPHKTVLENITLAQTVVQKKSTAEATKIAHELLKKVGLEAMANQYPSQLSGGQQQRVGIARSLAVNPDLILLDEPTSALDRELVSEVLQVLKKLAQEGWTMLIVTHELSFAREISNQVILMENGEIVEKGNVKDFFSHPQKERTRMFLRSEDLKGDFQDYVL